MGYENELFAAVIASRSPLGSAVLLAVGWAAAQTQPPPEGATSEAGATLTVAVGVPERDPAQNEAIAHGQEEEDPPAADDPHAGSLPAAGAGFRGTFGRALTEGVADGWFGRLEVEAYSAAGKFDAGPMAGALIGGEIWTAEDAGGGGLPMSVYFGMRSPFLISQLGLGFNLFVYDKVHDDGGFGLYTPFGFFSLGFELSGFRLMADARATYRWQWGADDRGQIALGVSVAHVFESSTRKRRVEARPPYAR